MAAETTTHTDEAGAAVSPDRSMVDAGDLAHADEVIPGPDAPPMYPPSVVDMFEKYGHELEPSTNGVTSAGTASH